MQITRRGVDTQKGPAGWFPGDVYIDAVAAPAGHVHVRRGARVHVAIQQADDSGSPVTWGEHVTDAEYAGMD